MIINTDRIEDYRKFLRIKQLPVYRFRGCVAEYPQEYENIVNGKKARRKAATDGTLSPFLFDYQRAIVDIALRKQRFCVFADCGLGKTLIFLEYVRRVLDSLPQDQCALIVSPLMVVNQTVAECEKFYGDSLKLYRVASNEINHFLAAIDGPRVGITNFEAFSRDVDQGRLGCLVVDESSMLKSHYGKWGTSIVRLGRGISWKLALTGTPAPNDRIEYANHGVLMDAYPTVNSFLAKYFVNRGETSERWELKPHALDNFYRDISHWCIFLTDPRTYGWHDNVEQLPPINVHIHEVPMTDEQTEIAQDKTGDLFVTKLGGISSRSKLATISKGFSGKERIESRKPNYIRKLVESWPDESTIIWCLYNEEQAILEECMPFAESITGDTPLAEREGIIADFKAGRCKVLITKPKILGFGLNLQIATRQIFSGLQDSYESYYQAVKRSNRYGAKRPLNIHIPVTDIERPMIETVLSKARRVQKDAEEQERIFKNAAPNWR